MNCDDWNMQIPTLKQHPKSHLQFRVRTKPNDEVEKALRNRAKGLLQKNLLQMLNLAKKRLVSFRVIPPVQKFFVFENGLMIYSHGIIMMCGIISRLMTLAFMAYIVRTHGSIRPCPCPKWEENYYFPRKKSLR